MPHLPKEVRIIEVGPRDGLQIEPKILLTEQKAELIGMLADAGLCEIEVASFVNPAAVPQMADADELIARLPKRGDLTYRALFLNPRGLDRAIGSHGIGVRGDLFVSASNTFSLRNMNRSTDQVISEIPAWISRYEANGIVPDSLSVMAAFGCNFEGDISIATVVGVIDRVAETLDRAGHRLRHISLSDTMGWANPEHVRRLVGEVQSRWPEAELKLHLHDTRGMAVANAMAGLEAGVCLFESSIGGLGGCPFAGNKGASGNICTEDFAFLCEELGLSTGLDLERLIAAAQRAEQMVGHELPGKLMKGGPLGRYRA